MKYFFVIFICFTISISSIGQNRFKAGLRAGLSASQVAGDTYSGFNKAGFVGGGFLRSSLNENWSAQFEILFIQKGSRHNGGSDSLGITYYLLQLNYIEVPIDFQYHHKKFLFELGLGVGALVSVKEENINGPINSPSPFLSPEFSFNAGISYNLIKNLDATWRYSNSLNAIRKHNSGAAFWWNPGQQNSVMTFTLTYWFGNGGDNE